MSKAIGKKAGQVTLRVSGADARALVLLIRKRQDDVRHVRPEDRNFKVFNDLDHDLEALKFRLVKQIPQTVFDVAPAVNV